MRFFTLLPAALLIVLVQGCGVIPPGEWIRGSTCAHSSRGEGDTPPEFVAKWYHDNGYSFVVMSDKNLFYNVKEVVLPGNEPKRKDFVLVPGETVVDARSGVRVGVINNGRVIPSPIEKSAALFVQTVLDDTAMAGGVAVIKHPNFGYGLTLADLSGLKGVLHMEVYSTRPGANNDGDKDHPSAEALWDALLTKGKAVYGVACDDFTSYAKIPPVRAWIMVATDSLEPKDIASAIRNGEFYSTTGVLLSGFKAAQDEYSVAVDVEKMEALRREFKLHGTPAPDADEGCRIDFIGAKGEIIKSSSWSSSSLGVDKDYPYVRAKVSYTFKNRDGQLEQVFAWTQPVFTDGRLAKIAEEEKKRAPSWKKNGDVKPDMQKIMKMIEEDQKKQRRKTDGE